MINRLSAMLVAIGLLAGVIYLGILSGQDSKFVVWFGIASAIAAPIGLSLLAYALRNSDGDLVQSLAKVPEIRRMIDDAKTQEEKIRLLEAERARLSEIIRLESRRQAVSDRIETLSQDAIRIVQEFESLERESHDLDDEIGHSAVSEEIRRLRERVRARERGDVVLTLGSRTYRIDRDIIKALPTDLKLSVVEAYLSTFTAALTGKWPHLWYIDAFAGSGSRTVRVEARDGDLFDEPVPEQVEQRRGSARIALDIKPPFNRVVFLEQKPRHCAALRELKAQYPGRDIEIVEGNANELIRNEITWDGWRRTRAVMFLDPYGMTVDWDTLKAIAATKAIDVWYLFSLSGLYRQAARRIDSIDLTKRAAITRMLGTDAWEGELYSSPPRDLLSALDMPPDRQRAADVTGLELYVQRRLNELFPYVLEPLALPINKKPQRFSLFFAVSNPDPKAIGLAKRFARYAVSAGRSSHVRP
jgi:three-Cys-motif partner protein